MVMKWKQGARYKRYTSAEKLKMDEMMRKEYQKLMLVRIDSTVPCCRQLTLR